MDVEFNKEDVRSHVTTVSEEDGHPDRQPESCSRESKKNGVDVGRSQRRISAIRKPHFASEQIVFCLRQVASRTNTPERRVRV